MGELPKIQGIHIQWTKFANEEFQKYWSPILELVIPRFPEIQGKVLQIGVTSGTPCYMHDTGPYGHHHKDVIYIRLGNKPYWAKDEVFTVAHELAHWVYDERFIDLMAYKRVGHLFYSAPTSDYLAIPKEMRSGEWIDTINTLALMALKENGGSKPSEWFEARLLEVLEGVK